MQHMPQILIHRDGLRQAKIPACRYGHGTYFAKNAADQRHSAPDANEHRHMLLCNVALGRFFVGNSDIRAPLNDPFGSTVDDIDDPTIFVAYQDYQAFPLYIITFKNPPRPTTDTVEVAVRCHEYFSGNPQL